MRHAVTLVLLFLAAPLMGQEPTRMMGLPLRPAPPPSTPSRPSDSTHESDLRLFATSSNRFGPCPKTLDEWKTWRRQKFMQVVSDHGLNLTVANGDSLELRSSLSDFLNGCKTGQKEIHELPEFRACFTRVLELEKASLSFISGALDAGKTVSAVAGFPSTYTEKN